ncbi:MAG: single-stranded DNA-binding protein [Clostridia bacterium]|nr:single-stranded DNA-binding protein [Clostridia bacterium]
MNKVILIGNLTKDPELSQTNNGLAVCKFTVAVSRSYGNKETDFFTVIAWRTQAENCARFLKKGSKVAICGSIQNRSYDGNDGVKRYVTEIVADEVQFLTTKGQAEEEVSSPIRDIKPVDDDLPF